MAHRVIHFAASISDRGDDGVHVIHHVVHHVIAPRAD
jgi:hypothetical protein